MWPWHAHSLSTSLRQYKSYYYAVALPVVLVEVLVLYKYECFDWRTNLHASMHFIVYILLQYQSSQYSSAGSILKTQLPLYMCISIHTINLHVWNTCTSKWIFEMYVCICVHVGAQTKITTTVPVPVQRATCSDELQLVTMYSWYNLDVATFHLILLSWSILEILLEVRTSPQTTLQKSTVIALAFERCMAYGLHLQAGLSGPHHAHFSWCCNFCLVCRQICSDVVVR